MIPSKYILSMEGYLKVFAKLNRFPQSPRDIYFSFINSTQVGMRVRYRRGRPLVGGSSTKPWWAVDKRDIVIELNGPVNVVYHTDMIASSMLFPPVDRDVIKEADLLSSFKVFSHQRT